MITKSHLNQDPRRKECLSFSRSLLKKSDMDPRKTRTKCLTVIIRLVKGQFESRSVYTADLIFEDVLVFMPDFVMFSCWSRNEECAETSFSLCLSLSLSLSLLYYCQRSQLMNDIVVFLFGRCFQDHVINHIHKRLSYPTGNSFQ
jgi:hypothetical protein